MSKLKFKTRKQVEFLSKNPQVIKTIYSLIGSKSRRRIADYLNAQEWVRMLDHFEPITTYTVERLIRNEEPFEFSVEWLTKNGITSDVRDRVRGEISKHAGRLSKKAVNGATRSAKTTPAVRTSYPGMTDEQEELLFKLFHARREYEELLNRVEEMGFDRKSAHAHASIWSDGSLLRTKQ